MPAFDIARIEQAARDLGAAATDPGLWPQIMEEICRAAGASGAILLQSDVRTPDVPHTAGVHELASAYFAEGWHLRDVRIRCVPQLLSGEPVVLDQDIPDFGDPEARLYYNEFLLRYGFWWFAAIGFQAGSSLWALALQRTVKEGAFTAEEKRVLAQLSPGLTEAATLSTAVGRSVISGVSSALASIGRAALLLDRFGRVLDANEAADGLFGDDLCLRADPERC